MIKKMKMNSRGFTLMEIVVVVLVISLLTLLATPKYLTYTKDAKVKRMQSDIHVLSNAILTYQVDHDGNWPLVGVDADGDGKISDREVSDIDITSFPVSSILTETHSHQIDGSKLHNYVQKLHGDYDDYIFFILGPYEAKAFHRYGVEAGDMKTWYGVEEQYSN